MVGSQNGTHGQVRALLSPIGREFLDALHGKVDREFRGTDAERHELKLHGAQAGREGGARGSGRRQPRL